MTIFRGPHRGILGSLMTSTVTIFLVLLFVSGCSMMLDEFDQVHYGLTKEQVISKLGQPKRIQKWIISDNETLKALIDEADMNNGAIRLAKVGDKVHEYQYVKKGKTLIVMFLNDNNRPVNIYTTER